MILGNTRYKYKANNPKVLCYTSNLHQHNVLMVIWVFYAIKCHYVNKVLTYLIEYQSHFKHCIPYENAINRINRVRLINLSRGNSVFSSYAIPARVSTFFTR